MRIPPQVEDLVRRQSHAVTREQLVDAGVTPSWIDRRVRAGAWQRLHPGVYVTHSGPVAWRTRAVAGLLHAGPGAALSHATAAYRHEIVDTAPRVVHVSVPHDRRVARTPGLVVVRRRAMPPAFGRLRTVAAPDTVVDLVERARDADDVVGILTAAARARVAPQHVLEAATGRDRVRGRALLVELLGAVADGVESTLEHRYHRDVERRHGLPRSRLQVRHRLDHGWIRADCVYTGLGVRVELDGRLAHPGGRTDADTWRDNAVLLAVGEITLRYRWAHVVGTPCATARQVAEALTLRGWDGSPRPCGPTCAVVTAR